MFDWDLAARSCCKAREVTSENSEVMTLWTTRYRQYPSTVNLLKLLEHLVLRSCPNVGWDWMGSDWCDSVELTALAGPPKGNWLPWLTLGYHILWSQWHWQYAKHLRLRHRERERVNVLTCIWWVLLHFSITCCELCQGCKGPRKPPWSCTFSGGSDIDSCFHPQKCECGKVAESRSRQNEREKCCWDMGRCHSEQSRRLDAVG